MSSSVVLLPAKQRSIFRAKPDPQALRARLHGLRWLWVWLPAVAMCMVIFAESTDTFSAAHTSGFLRPIFEALGGRLSEATWTEVHHLIRKSGHFMGYGMVCLSFLRGWLFTLGRRIALSVSAWRLHSAVRAVLCTAAIASADEIHQTYLPSRTGTPWDVLLDTCGATAMCLLVALLFWVKRRDGGAPSAG